MQHRNTDKRYSNSQNSLVFNFELLNLPWKFHNKNKGGGEFNCNSRSVGICSKPKFQGNFAIWIERECFENSLNFTSQIDSSSILFKSPCRLCFYSKRQLFHSIKKRTRLRVSLCGKPKKILSAVTIDEIGFLFKLVQEFNFKILRYLFWFFSIFFPVLHSKTSCF